MSESYPCQYSSTALLSLMAALQATVFALCTEKDWSQWRLSPDIRLLTVMYTVYIKLHFGCYKTYLRFKLFWCMYVSLQGMLVSGMMISLISWCVRMRGPLFVSVFNPLMLVLVAIASSLLLKEKLSVGRFVHNTMFRWTEYGTGLTLRLLDQMQRDRGGPDCGRALHGAVGKREGDEEIEPVGPVVTDLNIIISRTRIRVGPPGPKFYWNCH